MLSRYEVSRLVGMRALQLADGAPPAVVVSDATLRMNPVYVSARELYERRMDARVARDTGDVHVRDLALPSALMQMLDSLDGGERSFVMPGAP